MLLLDAEGVEPFGRFGVAQTVPFACRLRLWPFSTQLLADIFPEGIRLKGSALSGPGRLSQSPVTADYCHSLRSGVGADFILYRRIGIGARPGKQHFKIADIVETALVRRSRPVEDNHPGSADRSQIPAYNTAQLQIAGRLRSRIGLENSVQQIVAVNYKHGYSSQLAPADYQAQTAGNKVLERV